MTRQLVLFALCMLVHVMADLPIHCLHKQIAGKWQFRLSELTTEKGRKCGYSAPDSNKQHFKDPRAFDFNEVKTIQVDLQSPNTAVDSKGNQGQWTMVYDEGFQVQVGGFTYFAFMKYKPKPTTDLASEEVSDYISYCDQTMVGWYHSDNLEKWGCWQGSKAGAKSADTKKNKPVPGKGFVKPILKGRSSSVLLPMDEAAANPENNDDSVFDSSEAHPHDNIVSRMPAVDHDQIFEPDYSLVELINADTSSSWRAAVHEPFKGRKLKDMLNLLGKQNFNKNRFRSLETSDADADSDSDSDGSEDGPKASDKAKVGPGAIFDKKMGKLKDKGGLPANWDWRNVDGKNYVTDADNQLGCGSCYAWAGVAAYESRIRIKSKMKYTPKLSPQEILSCSFYNQGCEGGYPFLVSKHAHEFGLVERDAMDYLGSDTECPTEKLSKAKRWRIGKYGYVGGYYGGCSEQAMMREMYDNGPIIVAFQAPSSLFYYTGGIYTGPPPSWRTDQGIPKLNIWEQTNHAVTAVGWGVDSSSGIKYWIIKNTWGSSWGENGFFRIRRGTDECAIESMASAGEVIID